MSGYLHRLASTAMNSGGSLHPVVGSLFSSPKYESMRMPLEEDQAVVTAQPERPLAQASGEPDLPPPEIRSSTSLPRVVPLPSQPNLVPAKEEPVEAAAVHSVERSNEAAMPKQQRERLQDNPPELLPSDLKHLERMPAEPRRLAVESVRRLDAPPTPFSRSNPPAPPLGTFEKRYSPNPAARDRREPDEIQIHIGRIEVTAAPPPAVRTPAKPPRKSPSLDEYLKRGRGR